MLELAAPVVTTTGHGRHTATVYGHAFLAIAAILVLIATLALALPSGVSAGADGALTAPPPW